MLFEEMSGAKFSECRNYRYALWRIWDATLPKAMFIGLNPSTANEATNDPTIRRVIGFAKAGGYGGVYMLNLFAIISSDPDVLLTCADPINGNDFYLGSISKGVSAIVFCWGGFRQAKGRDQVIREMFPDALCLGKTQDGSPRHPLFLKGKTQFERFTPSKPSNIKH